MQAPPISLDAAPMSPSQQVRGWLKAWASSFLLCPPHPDIPLTSKYFKTIQAFTLPTLTPALGLAIATRPRSLQQCPMHLLPLRWPYLPWILRRVVGWDPPRLTQFPWFPSHRVTPQPSRCPPALSGPTATSDPVSPPCSGHTGLLASPLTCEVHGYRHPPHRQPLYLIPSSGGAVSLLH